MSINESRIAEKTVASEAVPFNRWVVVVGGIIVQLCLGAIYAWSAFTKALMADPYAFTKTQTHRSSSPGASFPSPSSWRSLPEDGRQRSGQSAGPITPSQKHATTKAA